MCHSLSKQSSQIFLLALVYAATKLAASQNYCCWDGWLVFEDSCYTFGSGPKTWEAARDACDEFDGTLLVVDSDVELQTILAKYGVRNQLTWIGLSYLSRSWEESVLWEAGGQYSVSRLPWMNKRDLNNGRQPGIDCAAYLAQVQDQTPGYVNWYKCQLQLHYICERNSTLHHQRRKRHNRLL